MTSASTATGEETLLVARRITLHGRYTGSKKVVSPAGLRSGECEEVGGTEDDQGAA